MGNLPFDFLMPHLIFLVLLQTPSPRQGHKCDRNGKECQQSLKMGKCRAVVKLLAELVSWRPRFIAGSHLSPIPLDVRYVAQISTVSWTNFKYTVNSIQFWAWLGGSANTHRTDSNAGHVDTYLQGWKYQVGQRTQCCFGPMRETLCCDMIKQI